MDPVWLTYIQFWAPYFAAGGTAWFVLLLSGKPLTLREMVGTAGLYFVVGGGISPLIPLAPFPGVTREAQNLGVSVAIGSRILKLETLAAAMRRLITGGSNERDPEPPKNA